MGYVISIFLALLVVCGIMALSPNFITRPIANFTGRLRGLPEHDPMDWRQTRTSGPWNTGTYCSNCKGWTEHKDLMAGICHSCGSRKGVRSYRSSRKIWNGRQWVVQHKYSDGPDGYEIVS
jgi:hypothetical protein